MTLFSHLSVQTYHDQLTQAMEQDSLSLLHNKQDLVDIDTLVQHTPIQFLKERPLIVVYSIAKPLGLFEHFMEYGDKSLTKPQSYSICKIIEIKYKMLNPRIMLPLSVSEINTVYDTTRSKIVVDLLGSVIPGGMYGTVTSRLVEQASQPVNVPTGLVLTQHDNNQVLGSTHETKVYNKQQLSLINANAHIICDSDDRYQYRPESYPGYNVYRDLSELERNEIVPEKLTTYKPIFRASRAQSAEFAIKHLEGDNSHEKMVNKLNQVANDLGDSKVCKKCGVVTKRVDIQRCVDCASGYLCRIDDEMVFTKFVNDLKSEGLRTEVRYSPFAGLKPIPDTKPKQQVIVPGDPDMIPPTTKVHVAELLNTAAHRANVRQVQNDLGLNVSGESGRFAMWIGNDMYLFIICRDLAKSTFTHLPCGTIWKGRQKMEEHLATCEEELTQELGEIYRVPGLPGVVLTFGWAMFLDGLWHTELNISMRIHERVLCPVFGNKLANIFGRRTPAAVENFYKASSHHKGDF